ncbi:TraR/DksA family transcriptional regulator [Thiogranum longum]|uniref:TraR/DksA family transcriptional regulator n=1 Tax=Thiogranum longum TaxID=1537524 RepID=A0A4R1H898_9GAMM|nr:TraR/DksA family transcriptional regulator [Thiogranum longum]TCK18064.1 TraR/DksA family transcriptional regulator [Thiogranum longum]
MTDYTAYETRLRALREEMVARINALEKDLHHQDQPVEKDFAEQVTQGENDDVLTALDDEARATVQKIDAALLRIKAGTYGVCERCGNPIGEKRLAAVPYTTVCIDCAEG